MNELLISKDDGKTFTKNNATIAPDVLYSKKSIYILPIFQNTT